MFQDSGNIITSSVVNFHNYVMLLGLFIFTGSVYVLCSSIAMRDFYRNFMDLPVLEFWWTIFPALILLIIALPSLSLLYKMDEILDPYLNLKVIGNQWYWTYEYDSQGQNIEINSYMITSEDLLNGDFRLREADNHVAVPVNTLVKVITTSNDVIHCWTIPSLGVKIDAVPGRLNQVGLISNRSGLMLGGCSEICGSDHAYMPIVLESVSLGLFNNWVNTLLENKYYD